MSRSIVIILLLLTQGSVFNILAGNKAPLSVTSARGDSPGFSQIALTTFTEVRDIISKRHFSTDTSSRQWGEICKKYEPMATRSRSQKELLAVLNRMCGELKQSHFQVMPPVGRSHRKIKSSLRSSGNPTEINDIPKTRSSKAVTNLNVPADTGIRATQAGDIICVHRVRPGSPAAKAKVVPGDQILEVRGLRINPGNEVDIPWTFIVRRLLSGRPGTFVTVKLLDPNTKKIRTVKLEKEPLDTQWIKFGVLPRTFGTFTYKILPGNIAYIYISHCFLPQIVKFRETIGELPEINGIILDLRDNPGGMLLSASGFVGLLCDKQLDIGKLDMRGLILTPKAYPQAEAYTGPVAVLINRDTGSAAEIMAAALQDHKRAALFGETTSGKCLQSEFMQLSTGYRLQAATGDYVRSSGKRIEGTGVAPDYPVKLDQKSLSRNHDTVLDAAKQYLKNRK